MRDETQTVDVTDIDVDGFTYLLAKYDGPNYGSVVWYVADVVGTVTIPTGLGANEAW